MTVKFEVKNCFNKIAIRVINGDIEHIAILEETSSVLSMSEFVLYINGIFSKLHINNMKWGTYRFLDGIYLTLTLYGNVCSMEKINFGDIQDSEEKLNRMYGNAKRYIDVLSYSEEICKCEEENKNFQFDNKYELEKEHERLNNEINKYRENRDKNSRKLENENINKIFYDFLVRTNVI